MEPNYGQSLCFWIGWNTIVTILLARRTPPISLSRVRGTRLMLPYWIFFLVPAAAALVSSPHMRFRAGGTRSLHINETWILIILVLTMIIGFRYEVGGDWNTYSNMFNRINNIKFGGLATAADLTKFADPGYVALNILSIHFGDKHELLYKRFSLRSEPSISWVS